MVAIKQVIMSKLPENCSKCKLKYEYYEEDGFFGDNTTDKCIFGIDTNYTNRPKECPLIEIQIT